MTREITERLLKENEKLVKVESNLVAKKAISAKPITIIIGLFKYCLIICRFYFHYKYYI
jgi:hypothetical protein